MNGRLRRFPTTKPHRKITQKKEKEEEAEEDELNVQTDDCSVQRVVSLIPFKLPDGIITTHQIPSTASKALHDHDDRQQCGYGHGYGYGYGHNEMPFMLYHLKQIHRIKGEHIVDHCWSIVNLRKFNDEEEEKNDSKEEAKGGNGNCNCNNFWLVLAVLTRLGEDSGPEGGEPNNRSCPERESICTVLLYGRPLHGMEEGEESNEKENMLDNFSIDCCQGQKGDGCTPTMPSLFSLSHRIDLPYFVNGIAMDSNILVIGSYTGATIYDIQNVMSKAKTNNNSNYSYNYNYNYNHNDNAQTQTSSDSNDNNSNDEEKPLTSLRIMKSCIVQAMCISYPYFAAASGDRIGVWRVDDIIEHLHNQSQKEGGKSDDRNRNRTRLHPRSTKHKHLTAIWNTKVNIGQSRITCIGMTEGQNAGEILAISCWDGSAFVFQRCRGEADEDDDCDRSSSESRQRTWWSRVIPKESSSNEASGDDISGNLRSWEDPIIDSYVFPTFLALFSINEGVKAKRLIAVSCPGYKIVRCYDIDSGKWFKDVGSWQYNSQNTSHQGKFSQFFFHYHFHLLQF